MTLSEIAAYNAGVSAVLDLAERSAAGIEQMLILRPTRFNHAVAALRGLSEEGWALLKQIDGNGGSLGVDIKPDAPTKRSLRLSKEACARQSLI